MSDFTCPSCGWPQGPTHTTVWPSELVQRLPLSDPRVGEDYDRAHGHSPLAAPQGQEADMVAFGASDAACYKYPDDTPEHRAARAAFCEGAAWTVPTDAKEGENDEKKESGDSSPGREHRRLRAMANQPQTLAQAQTDIAILLTQIEYLEEIAETSLEDEDAALIAEIRSTWADAKEGEEDGKARTEIQTGGAIPASGVAEGGGRSATLTEAEEAVVRDAIRENNARARDEARRQGVTLHQTLIKDLIDRHSSTIPMNWLQKQTVKALEQLLRLTDTKEGEEDVSNRTYRWSRDRLHCSDCTDSRHHHRNAESVALTPDIVGLVERLIAAHMHTSIGLYREAADALERMERDVATAYRYAEAYGADVERLTDELTAAKKDIEQCNSTTNMRQGPIKSAEGAELSLRTTDVQARLYKQTLPDQSGSMLPWAELAKEALTQITAAKAEKDYAERKQSEYWGQLTAAKAEIAERKKAVNLWADELLKVRQMARVDIEKLEAENERLRAIIQRAIDGGVCSEEGWHQDASAALTRRGE